MTSQQLLHVVFSFLPFAVCLFWQICFVVHTKKSDGPKLYYTVYITTCMVLYFCHALFFTVGLSHGMECVWTLCSLSVYPLFYGYLCRLTSDTNVARRLMPWLIPGIIVAVSKYIFPDAGMDKVRLLLFACQIICVCYLGIRKLKVFDRELQSVYADTEGRDTTAVHHLLLAIIFVSILSGIANSVGKHYFGESIRLLILISIAFSTLFFALSYICFNRDFNIDNLHQDRNVNDVKEISAESTHEEDTTEFIGKKIEELMTEQHFFTKKDLKISDLAKEIGSNRTYVSNYINRTYKCTFSEYVNQLRIEYAKTLISSATDNTKLTLIAEESGYASEQSFYRNFKKIVGMTPTKWQKNNQKQPDSAKSYSS